jgi:hypothetical protein
MGAYDKKFLLSSGFEGILGSFLMFRLCGSGGFACLFQSLL